MTDKQLTLQGALWLSMAGEKFGSPQHLALLAQIAHSGSITQAAKAVKISYKAAWDAIDHMNNLAGEALVERLAGGKGGGGTRLTARGQQLVTNYQLIEREHQQFLHNLQRQASGLADDLLLLGGMSMKTSARNQFLGKVVAIKSGAVNDEVELEVAEGLRLVAVVTQDSVATLGLAVGGSAYALIKASSVIIGSGDDGMRLSARNQLRGTVSRLLAGAVNTEVVLELAPGSSIAAIITNASAQDMDLQPGSRAIAVFKASSVILGVPG
ncbi:MAG: TOBE domain-containing protein [Aquitalea sp.]|nr:TOBE domain-containing protein [Aquitalea sp.]